MTESKSQRVLEGYWLAIKGFEAEQDYLASLAAQMQTCKVIVNGSGMNNYNMVNTMDQIVMELQERAEAAANLAKDCKDALDEAERLIGTLGGIGIRERWKSILKMRYLLELSWRHIAARMGMDQRNVRTSHDAALRYLDAALELRGKRRLIEPVQ